MFHLILLALKAPYTGPKAALASALNGVKAVWAMVATKPTIDSALAPFSKMHAQLSTVQADAKAAEAAVRTEITALLAKAEAQAAAGSRAAVTMAKLADLLGK